MTLAQKHDELTISSFLWRCREHARFACLSRARRWKACTCLEPIRLSCPNPSRPLPTLNSTACYNEPPFNTRSRLSTVMLPYQHPVTPQLSTAQHTGIDSRGCAFPLEHLLPQPKTTHKHFINKWYNHVDTFRVNWQGAVQHACLSLHATMRQSPLRMHPKLRQRLDDAHHENLHNLALDQERAPHRSGRPTGASALVKLPEGTSLSPAPACHPIIHTDTGLASCTPQICQPLKATSPGARTCSAHVPEQPRGTVHTLQLAHTRLTTPRICSSLQNVSRDEYQNI